MLTLGQLFLLAFAGLVAGAMNSIAGGGSLITFGTMIALGISPTLANTSSSVALVPGALSSLFAYRGDISRRDPLLWILAVAGLIGGAFGAFLLLRSGDDLFAKLVPWLLCGATVLFAFQGRVQAWLGAKPTDADLPPASGWRLWALFGFQVVVATYGGYFGAGIGILMLSALAFSGVRNLSRANGLKSVGAVAINSIAAAGFIASGHVHWTAAGAIMGGAIVGGFGGAVVARRAPKRLVRAAIVVVGLSITAISFWRLVTR